MIRSRILTKSILILGICIAVLSSCGQSVSLSAVATPGPSATLERAPTRVPTVEAGPSLQGGPLATVPVSSQQAQATAPGALRGTPVPAPGLEGQFVFAPGDGSIWIQDAASGISRALVTATADAFAEAPAFSPDGKHVAFMENKFSSSGAAESSIHLIDPDGKNDRKLASPTDAKTTLGSPAFSPDGLWVYFSSSFPVPPGKEQFEIRRVSIAGGTSLPVLQDAQSVAFSPEASLIVYQRFNTTNFSASLWVADAAGGNAKLIVPDDLFTIVDAPRFSPDGKWILFTASGPPTRPLPGAMLVPPRDCDPVLLCSLAGTAYADGLPWDLWLVSVDGKRFEQLTKVGFDSPWPAWSRDGSYIAIFETSGFYVLEVKKRVLSLWNAESGHGVMDWWSKGS